MHSARSRVFLVALSFLSHAILTLQIAEGLDLQTYKNVAESDSAAGGFGRGSQTLRTSCSDPSCAQCGTCDASRFKSEVFNCYRTVDALKLRLSENLSPLDIERECSFDACYPQQRQKYCDVLEHKPNADVLRELKSLLQAREKELASLKAQLEQKKRPYERNGLLAYGEKLEEARKVMAKQRADALKVRAYNAKLKKYLDSFKHKRAMYEVKRLRSESEELYGQKRFWDAQNQTLAHAVRLSAGAIKDARGDLHEKMLECEADAQLLKVMRSSTLAKEQQVQLVGALKAELRRRLDLAYTVNAHAKREAVFIEKARNEIYTLLQNVLTKLRQGRLQVECGGSALSSSVQNELGT